MIDTIDDAEQRGAARVHFRAKLDPTQLFLGDVTGSPISRGK